MHKKKWSHAFNFLAHHRGGETPRPVEPYHFQADLTWGDCSIKKRVKRSLWPNCTVDPTFVVEWLVNKLSGNHELGAEQERH